jgi:hypothetical protein
MTRRLIPIALLAACSTPKTEPLDEDTGTLPETGQIAIRYTIDPDIVDVMGEPARGVFYGQIFDADEVTALGPEEGAEPLDAIEHALDLGDGSVPTEILHTSVPIGLDEVVVLGFLDSDGNGSDMDYEPDGGDPVTLPGANEFDVEMGSTVSVTVDFGMLYPSR